jgi:hypothetical protein
LDRPKLSANLELGPSLKQNPAQHKLWKNQRGKMIYAIFVTAVVVAFCMLMVYMR